MSIIERFAESRARRGPDQGLVRLMREQMPLPDYRELALAAEQIILHYAGLADGSPVGRSELLRLSPYAIHAADALSRAEVLTRIASDIDDQYVLNVDALKASAQRTGDSHVDSGLVQLVREMRNSPPDEVIAQAAGRIIENYPENPGRYGVPESTLSEGVRYASEAIDCLVGAGVLVQDAENMDVGPDERFYSLDRSALEPNRSVPTDSHSSSSQ